jgi:NuA3 HAT complex component NTO1
MDEQGEWKTSAFSEFGSFAHVADQAWLDIINAERAKESSGSITYETFEILIDKLEKEWFELVSPVPFSGLTPLMSKIKRIPQPASHMPVEDSKCAICDDGEGENSNAIVFCDGCNLAVHQGQLIPDPSW